MVIWYPNDRRQKVEIVISAPTGDDWVAKVIRALVKEAD